jgi:hypothetical protein
MTREDVIRMAKKAGVWGPFMGEDEDLERFANLIAAAEREACVRVCEDVHAGKYDAPEFWREGVAYTCAAAIRARSKA